MTDDISLWTAGGGLAFGLVFGLIMQRSRFCLVAAVSNMLLIRDYRYIQAFLAALAVAIAGTALLESTQLVAIGESAYRGARLDWLGALGGGLLFGLGAALAGGCAARTLVNAAEGHMGSVLVLLVMSAFCGITQYGPLEPVRVALMQHTALQLQSGDTGLAALTGVAPWIIGLLLATACVAGIRVCGPLQDNRALLAAGGGIGLLVAGAWLFTGWAVQDPFGGSAPGSVIITGPLAKFSYYLGSGARPSMSFGLAFVPGLVAGAFLSAVLGNRCRLTRPDPSRIPHYITGGIFMGIGATVAGGCNIGQGLSGVSTLSLTSLLAAAAIFAGAAAGVRWWEWYVGNAG